MTSPVYVNSSVGGLASTASATSLTISLPTNLVVGNLLVLFFRATTAGTFTQPAGWTPLPGSSGLTIGWYRIVNGAETAPVVSWVGSGNKAATAKIFQFSGNEKQSLLSVFSVNSGTSTQITDPALTTGRDNSLVFALLTTNGAQTIPLPSGFTTRDSSSFDSNGSFRLCDKVIPTSGSSSGSISVTISNLAWSAEMFEITLLTKADAVQILSAPTQEIDVTANGPATVAVLDQTLFAPTQAAAATERESSAIAQMLFNIVEAASNIEMETAAVTQTLSGITQEIDITETELTSITQMLFAPGQEIDATEIEPAGEPDTTFIGQTLVGIEQEADAVEVVTAVIGQSFRRRFFVQLVLADIAQTFRRRLVTNTASAAITTELRGFSQAARVRNVAFGTHPLRPGQSGIDAPHEARQPPISNAELEFFRVKAYARGVDGMVPPSVIAQRNLTSDRLPKPRPVVKPFPQRGKPK